MANQYTFSIDIIAEDDDKNYYVIVPALPGCYSQGRTIEEAKRNIEDAIALHIQALKKTREPIPSEGTTFQTVIKVAA